MTKELKDGHEARIEEAHVPYEAHGSEEVPNCEEAPDKDDHCWDAVYVIMRSKKDVTTVMEISN